MPNIHSLNFQFFEQKNQKRDCPSKGSLLLINTQGVILNTYGVFFITPIVLFSVHQEQDDPF